MSDPSIPACTGTAITPSLPAAHGPAPAPAGAAGRGAQIAPGLALATAVAGVATIIGARLPVIGAPVTGIVLGVVLSTIVRPGVRLRPGIAVASRTVLQISVVVLGSQLSLRQVVAVGTGSLPVMLGTLAACLVGAFWIGRWLGVVGDLRTLIGVGTGICGASAIAAVTPVIGAVEADVAYAVSTIFLFNVAAVLAFPILGHLLGLSQHTFGLFAGTAVNDMSSVVATATTYGHEATGYAIVVKLTRTLLIIPISFGLAALSSRRSRIGRSAVSAAATGGTEGTSVTAGAETSPPPAVGRRRVRVARLVPPFLIGFLLLAAANSAGLIPAASHAGLATISAFLITVALTATGLSTDIVGLRRAGHRPLLLGAALWVLVSVTSLGLQRLSGTL